MKGYEMCYLTDYVQVGGRHKVAVFVSDFIQSIMPRRESGNDDFNEGAVSVQRDESSVPQVVVVYVALAKQLHWATRGFRVKGTHG